VLRSVRTLRPGARVLEVGSGVEGLGTWDRRRFVGADLAFTGPPLPWLHAVVANGTRLPFPDRSFDLVACVDVLPELPRDLVSPICAEMARVARGSVVIVSVCGEDAERSNRRTMEWCRRHGHPPPEWLVHLVDTGVPAVADIESALASHGRVTTAPNTSAAWHERLFRLEHRLRLIHAMTALQPVLRLVGRVAPFELPGRGPVYRWRFRLDTQATGSPPARRS
jgi:SAM-dependent methyltransferase